MGIEIGDHEFPPRFQDPDHFPDRRRRRFHMMEIHVGEGMIDSIVGYGQGLRSARPIPDVGMIGKFLFHDFQHGLRLIHGNHPYVPLDKSFRYETAPGPDIGGQFSRLHTRHAKGLFPHCFRKEPHSHRIPPGSNMIEITFTVRQLLHFRSRLTS